MHYVIGFIAGGITCGAAAGILMYLHYRQVSAAVNNTQAEAINQVKSAHSKLDQILSILHGK